MLASFRIKQALADVRAVGSQPLTLMGSKQTWDLRLANVGVGQVQTVYLQLGRWANPKVGDQHRVRVLFRDPKTQGNLAGSTYSVSFAK